MKRYHSIEYWDDEGECVIKHAMLTTDEARKIVEEFAARGIRGSVNDLTPQAVDDAGVLSGDDQSRQLEAAPRGRVE